MAAFPGVPDAAGRPATLWDGWLGARLYAGDDGIDEVSIRLRRDIRAFLYGHPPTFTAEPGNSAETA